MNKEELINIFKETIELVSEHKSYELPNGDIYDFKPIGKTFTYTTKPIELARKTPFDSTIIRVIDGDCLQVAEELVKDGNKCAVLNMASFIRPGGGVLKGSSAQEESLFRRTNLFMSLYQFSTDMYQVTGISEPITDVYPLPMNYGSIYTKDVTVFRKSERGNNCELMNNPFMIDVITIAAIKHPPLESNGKMSKWAVEVLKKKVETMLDLCIIHGVDIPVLGAFGCGSYATPPDQMAEIFRDVLCSDKYKGQFKTIVFPIIDDHNSHKEHNPEGNFKPFKEILPEKI